MLLMIIWSKLYEGEMITSAIPGRALQECSLSFLSQLPELPAIVFSSEKELNVYSGDAWEIHLSADPIKRPKANQTNLHALKSTHGQIWIDILEILNSAIWIMWT